MLLDRYIPPPLKEDSDFFIRKTRLSQLSVNIIGYTSLIDLPRTLELLHKQAESGTVADLNAEAFMESFGKPVKAPDESTIMTTVTRGDILLYFSEHDAFISVTPVPKVLTRSIEAPTTENVLRGAISSLVEDIETNIGMIKKHAATQQLRVKSYSIGDREGKRLSLLYREDKLDLALLRAITGKIESRLDWDVKNLQQLSDMLGFSRWSFVTRFNSTELPQEAERGLSQGKAILLLDRMPFALVVPSLLWDLFAVDNDHNFPVLLMYLVRLLRIVGVLTNMIVPGLYVALVSVNPDVLRIELALSIARSRVDVPYPAIVETLLLLIILELILEASIRLPKSIGPTLTMVGGIILGQAVVSAKLVSNLLIIILAATTISSSTVVGFQNSISIRVFKYLILLLSAFYGVLGLLSGLVIICAYLASITSFGIPYLHFYKPKGDSRG
ncbi:spore gernimation protein GerA [Paenibacillus nanensis]|uniref:Spore gernimation protein GerA n=1 Tax=Paenibacillus nanensis TaxID=393251 RepID=A0A3A1VEN7_9BACL|nr:spore germination protein [Paenibacillus nanensis]RIX59378.1 spore gernimation protein GerA [Paenibacillus nanensis]